MNTLTIEDVGPKLGDLLLSDSLESDDIAIVDNKGETAGVVISKAAYDFLLRKVEEEEDRIDAESVDEFNQSGERDQ